MARIGPTNWHPFCFFVAVIQYFLYKFGALFIFVALLLGILGLPIPDEVLLISSGVLVAHRKLSPTSVMIAAALGSITGITLSYLLGRWLGPLVIRKYGKFFHITEERVAITKGWFRRIGKWLLIVGYFIPLFRHLTGFVAGATKLDFLVFALYAYSGALIWASLFLALGYFLGE